MKEWILANGGSLLVSLILLLIIYLILRSMIRDHKRGVPVCGGCGSSGGCGSCPMSAEGCCSKKKVGEASLSPLKDRIRRMKAEKEAG